MLEKLKTDLSAALVISAGALAGSGYLLTRLRLDNERLPTEGILSERAGELGEDRQIGVQPYALDPAYAQRQQRPFVLETAELGTSARALPNPLPTAPIRALAARPGEAESPALA